MFEVEDACIFEALKAIWVVKELMMSLFDILATMFISQVNFLTQLLFLSNFINFH